MIATEIIGTDRAEAVICDNGERVKADLVIIGIGDTPNIELTEKCGLDIDNVILVNEFAQTGDENIVAAGDCTNHPNPIYGCNIRLKSVPNATAQAKTAAASVCVNKNPHSSLPWFWFDQNDLKLRIAGLNRNFDQVVIRGDIKNARNFVAWYLKDGVVIAADCINRPIEFMLAKQLIQSDKEIPIAKLADDSIDPKTMLALLKVVAP